MSKNKWVKYVICILILASVIIFFIPSIVNALIPNVQTESFKNRKIKKTIYFEASLEARETYDIYLPENTSVKEFYVKYGDFVGNDMPVFKLNNFENRAQTEKEKQALTYNLKNSELKIARAEKEKLKKEIQLNEEKRVAAEKNILLKKSMLKGEIITQKEYDDYFAAYQQLLNDIALTKQANQIKQLEKDMEIVAIENYIKSLRKSVNTGDYANSDYYIDKDGVCRITGNGYVKYIDKSYDRTNEKIKVMEVNKYKDFNSLVFYAKIPMKDKNYFNVGDILKIDSNDVQKPHLAEIKNISAVADENNQLLLELIFSEEPQTTFNIGNMYRGKIEVMLKDEKYQTIPIRAFGAREIEEEKNNYIYVVDENKKNLLGNVSVEKIELEIMKLGDEYALCKLSERYTKMIQNKKLIMNIDYRLENGKKVHICY